VGWAIIAAQGGSRQRVRVRGQFRVGEARPDRRVAAPGAVAIAARLAMLVPVAKLFPPELLREDLFSAVNALGNFRVRSRQYLIVNRSLPRSLSGDRLMSIP
jgi:hypothetical protein